MPTAIIACLIGVLLGAGALCVILIPKLKQTQELDKQIEQQNITARAELTALEQKTEYLTQSYHEKYQEYNRIRADVERESAQAEQAAKGYYDKMMGIYKQKLDYDLEEVKRNYDKASAEYREEYHQVLAEAINDFQDKIAGLQEEEILKQNALAMLQQKLGVEAATVMAAVEANKRAAEMESQEDFYKLNLLDEDLEEITELRKCTKHLRNPEPLNKVIWKVYYEKATTDLIGRVVGSGVHCGIYKITNLNNGMCYVGQAVNIADRWKQHIKRGIGADTPTRNKLYPAMLSIGVENFSFEIIEECERDRLNEREDYWQEFFKAKEFGYSIK